MNAWVLRAVALGGLVVVARVLLGFVMTVWPTHSSPIRLLLFVIVLLATAWWGLIDGRQDRETYPDPDHGMDLTVLWLKAAAVAGLGSGALAWILGRLPVVDVGGNSLFFELTSGAAFIVLAIFLPAMFGIAVGRFLARRDADNRAAHAKPLGESLT